MQAFRSVAACALSLIAASSQGTRLAARQATSSKQVVWVNHRGADQVGSTFTYQLREALGASSIFTLAPTEDTCPKITIDVLSVQIALGSGDSSAIGVAYLLTPCPNDPEVKILNGSPIFLNHAVLAVGRDKTQQTALDTLAELDRLYRSMRSK